MRFLTVCFFILFPLLSHSQDRSIHFVFYKLERYKHSSDTVFLNRYYKDEIEQMFFYVKVGNNKWQGINDEGITEIGKFRRKFNIFTPWWNVLSNPVQMRKVKIWEYHLPDRIDYVNYRRNNGCCHSLYKSNVINK